MKYNVLTQLKAKSTPEGSYADGQGLWLVKADKARGKWVLRVFVVGRREMGLGRWPDVSIAEAHEDRHGAPYSARGEALKVVELCREKSKHHLFPAYKGQPISAAAMATPMKRQGYDARPHGFHATFRTWCEEATSADYETKESVLGPAVDAGVVGPISALI